MPIVLYVYLYVQIAVAVLFGKQIFGGKVQLYLFAKLVEDFPTGSLLLLISSG